MDGIEFPSGKIAILNAFSLDTLDAACDYTATFMIMFNSHDVVELKNATLNVFVCECMYDLDFVRVNIDAHHDTSFIENHKPDMKNNFQTRTFHLKNIMLYIICCSNK